MKQWYTLYTKPNAEYQVAAALEQQELQTFLPEMVNNEEGCSGKLRPFFPCYLFVRVDLKAVGLSVVQWTPGLRRIVSAGDRPVPLSDQVIELIRSKVGQFEANGHGFKPGDTVRITAGPLQDLLAIFDGPSTPARRVQVLLQFLGASKVQVDVNDLEKAPPQVKTPPPRRARRTRGRGRWVRTDRKSSNAA